MNCVVFVLIFLVAFLNTAAQIVFKIGMTKIGVFVFNWSSVIPIAIKVMISPWIFFGMIIYVGSVGTWLMVLSRVPVSVAYPISSVAYILSAIASYYLLGEDLSLMRIMGIMTILIGVCVVASS